MSFLNPTLLAFTAAVAVPILIHLLNRRRFQRVSWAAMRFVRASLERNRRRLQLEDLLLLALRCLIVGLLALALARPAFRSATAFFGGSRIAAVLILDHSASLNATDGTRSRLDLVRLAAEAAVDALPPGSPVAVLWAGNRVTAAVADPAHDLNLVRKALRDTPRSDLATDHAASIAAALEILRGQTALRKEVILVTDRQALGWRRLPEIQSLFETAARDTRLRVLLVGEPLEDNLAVTSLSRPPGFASAREPLRFHAEIANLGTTPARQVRVTFHVDAGPAVDEAVLDLLAPGESRRATFFARFRDDGFHTVSARLAPDRLAADDERSLVVQVVSEVRVLVVDGDPAANSAFFVRHALQPVPSEAAARYFLQPRVVTTAQLSATRLDDFGAVVLTDPPPLLPPVVDQLARYVAEGGALILFPGPQARPEFYRNELLNRTGLLPADLREIRGDPDNPAEAFRLQASGYQHPLFELWNEAGAGSLASARFRAAWNLEPAPPRTNTLGGLESSEVMVRYADGQPAAVERSFGRGRVLLFSSTAGTAWNDLAVNPAFVPVLHRAVGTLTDAQEARYNVRAGDRVTLQLPSELAGRDVTIVGAVKPETRITRTLRATPGGAALEFEDTPRAGVFSVELPGSATPLAKFAVRVDPAESDLVELAADRRAELDALAQTVDWSPDLELGAAFERDRVGLEVWLPLTLAVLLLGLTETWLAQRFSRPK